MVVALLYEMQTPCNCFTLSLSGSDSGSSNSWRDDNDATMEIKVSRRWWWWSRRCFQDGDHKHKMMMAISYHLYWLHVMFILYASYLALIDGSWGSPGLGGVRIAELSSSAGLQDYEDTRLKTSSRVRMGLSLAWKASLAIRICRSPTIVTDSM